MLKGLYCWMATGVLTLVLLGSSVCLAQAYVSPGAPQGFVNDFANVLTPAEEVALADLIRAHTQQTTNEIGVVTIPSLGDETVESYANQLFQEWGIGKKGQDNGVLILLAIQNRKLRIEVGYGIEPLLTDATSKQIIQEAVPFLKEADYNAALTSMVNDVEHVLSGGAIGGTTPTFGEEVALAKASASEVFLNLILPILPFVVFVVVMLVIGIVAFVRVLRRAVPPGRFRRTSSSTWDESPSMSWGSSSSSDSSSSDSSSSSSSSDSFSGGSSGGGGASGDW